MFMIMIQVGKETYAWDGHFDSLVNKERKPMKFSKPPFDIFKQVKAYYSGQANDIWIGEIVQNETVVYRPEYILYGSDILNLDNICGPFHDQKTINKFIKNDIRKPYGITYMASINDNIIGNYCFVAYHNKDKIEEIFGPFETSEEAQEKTENFPDWECIVMNIEDPEIYFEAARLCETK